MSAESTRIDRDGLLCALVLAPTTFARNRFFALYTEPWARRTRSRAAQLRTIVRHLAALTPKPELHELVSLEDGGTVIRYGVPDLHFERTALLEPLELAIVRFALSRRPRAVATPPADGPVSGRSGSPPADGRCEPSDLPIEATEEDRRRVEQALAKLSQRLGPSSLDELENSRF